ncbi:MAG: hypothetical protein BGO98_25705 [Myxococcales bacterium 68-20]|nr:IgGFc-binding protein [Myxococcales bacterium]OJY16043.1 MAG: hypothetical protein BGO98_25705 [Myxococcales bacterium 68-20]
MIVRARRVAPAAVLGLIFSVALACGENRVVVTPPPRDFGPSADAGRCDDRCSLDGRSVVNCRDELVETCPTDLACGGGRCQPQCAAAAAEGSSNGCEFYLQSPLLSALNKAQSCYAAYIVNTSTVPVDVELEYEGQMLDISKSVYRTESGAATLTRHSGPVSPGEGVVLFVSDDPASKTSPGSFGHYPCPPGVEAALYYDFNPKTTLFGSSFHLKTSAPVSAATIFPFGGGSTEMPTATLLLPVATWAKENLLINAWSSAVLAPAGVQIVASEDDTDVTIVPKRDIQDGVGVMGARAGTPATYRLKKGQFLQFAQNEELTGSFVTSTKPTSTFGVHSCMNVPAYRGPCDIANQQIPAYEQWGSEYVGVGYRPRVGNEHEVMPYRIMAARDGTRLDYDPEVPVGAPLELNAGEMVPFAAGVGDAFVVRTQDAEHPIYLSAHMTSAGFDYLGNARDYNGLGDPEFVNVVAAGQYLSSASFFADPTYAETSLVIVRAKTGGEFKDVILECLGGPVSGFRPVGTRGEYEFTRVTLSDRRRPGLKSDGKLCYYGAHHLRSEGAFTATLWGMDAFASYAYPSGMATRKLVTAPLVTK